MKDDPTQTPQCDALVARIESGGLIVQISEFVVFELVFLLERSFKRTKREVRDELQLLLHLPGIILAGKERLDRALDYYATLNVSFPDAYKAVLMEQLGITEVISFDRDFDRIPAVTRLDP